MSETVVVEIKHEQLYQHSLGQNSAFFAALQTNTLVCGLCPECGQRSVPPRPHCQQDGAATNLETIAGAGTVVVASTVSRRPSYAASGGPMIDLGLVQLDGVANAMLVELVDSDDVPSSALQRGSRVRATYRESTNHPVQHVAFAGVLGAENHIEPNQIKETGQ